MVEPLAKPARQVFSPLTAPVRLLTGLVVLALWILPGCNTPVHPVSIHQATFSERLSPQTTVVPSPNVPPTGAPSLRMLTLEDAVHECLTADPRLRAGAEAVTQAFAEVWTASLLPNPVLTADISLLPLTRPFTITSQGGPPQLDLYLAFPVDWLVFGKRAARLRSARAGVDVADAEFADLVRQRVAGVVAAYHDLAEAQAQLVLGREDLEVLQRLQAVARQRGPAGAADGERLRQAVAESQRELRRREAAVTTTRAALRAQLGRADAAPELEVEATLEVQAATPPPSVAEAWHLADQHRPDVSALRLRIAKAEADLHNERKKGYPEIKPRVGFTRQFQEKVIGFPDASSYGLGADVPLPLFDRNQGNASKAQSALTQSILTCQAQLVQVRAEIEQAVAEFRVAYEDVLANTPEQLQGDRAERDKTEAAYRAGQKPLGEVLETQRTYRDSAKLSLTERTAYWKALYRLNATLGTSVR